MYQKRVPCITVVMREGFCVGFQYDMYLDNKLENHIGIINLNSWEITIDNLWLDELTKLDICLGLAYDSMLAHAIKVRKDACSDNYEDTFHSLYQCKFKPRGLYEVHLMGDNFPTAIFNNEQEAEDRASYLTETDIDGDKYEVIIRGNPYEQYNN